MKTKRTSDGKKGGLLKGKSHEKGGMPAVVVSDNNRPIEVEGDEVIINKKTVKSQKKHTFDGKEMTPKEILSELNQEGGGVPIYEKGGEISVYGAGGRIWNKDKSIEITYEQQKNGNYKVDFPDGKKEISGFELYKYLKKNDFMQQGGQVQSSMPLGQLSMFDKGGKIEKSKEHLHKTENYSINEKGFVVHNWESIPEFLKVIKKVPKKSINKFEPSDKGIKLIYNTFASNEELRPQFNAIYVTKTNLICSDAHVLISKPYKTPAKYHEKILDREFNEVDARYPNYESIFIDTWQSEAKKAVSCKINLYDLLCYLNAVPYFINQGSKLTRFMYKDRLDQYAQIGFKSEYMRKVIEYCLAEGYEQMNFYIIAPSKQLIITPPEHVYGGYNKDILQILVMPMMLEGYYNDDEDTFVDYPPFNADIDYSRKIMAVYDFSQNKILSSGKFVDTNPIFGRKIDSFKQANIPQRTIWDIKKAFPSNKTHLFILDYFAVRNGSLLYTSDLETKVQIENSGLDEGLYDYFNKCLIYFESGKDQDDTDKSLNDYPLFPEVKTKLGHINASDLYIALDYTLKYPQKSKHSSGVLTGFTIFQDKKDLKIYYTDRYIGIIEKVRGKIDFSIISDNYKYITIPFTVLQKLKYIINFSKPLEVWYNGEKTIIIKQGNLSVSLTMFNEDDKMPEFIEVVKKAGDKKIAIPELAHNRGEKNLNYYANKLFKTISNSASKEKYSPKVYIEDFEKKWVKAHKEANDMVIEDIQQQQVLINKLRTKKSKKKYRYDANLINEIYDAEQELERLEKERTKKINEPWSDHKAINVFFDKKDNTYKPSEVSTMLNKKYYKKGAFEIPKK